jgi:IgA Peptidase M64/Protein of unknown function (DUF2934)
MGVADGQVLGAHLIVNNGPASQRWNLVIVAEGYRDIEMPQFAADAAACAQALLASPPFDLLAAGINVHRLDIASVDSGADDPAACGGTGLVARTYLDASFCNNGIWRLLTVNVGMALQTVNTFVPQWHAIWVIVNSTVYGGSGGTVAVFSKDPNAHEIAFHELGHSAFGLADEYACYACTVQEEQSGMRNHHPGPEPIEPNVTIDANRATIKWGQLIDPLTPLPTTQNPDCTRVDNQASPVPTGTVGAFEGAHYYHCGAYRPEYNCRMRQISQPFCRVCRRAIVTTLAPFQPAPVPELLPHEEIAVAAYYLWVQGGMVHGQDRQHWFQATQEIWQQHFGVP